MLGGRVMFTTKSADQWFEEYGDSHQNQINKLIHWVMVPAIFFTVVGLLWGIPRMAWMGESVWMNWALVAMVPVMFFYVRMSVMIMVGMAIFTAMCFYLAYWLSANVSLPLWQLSLIIFVIAWVFQFVGHEIEGKKPSFFKDLQFLLVGPAWLMGFIYRRVGIKY
jgi:uncharacterized membrane protein YGL010W